MTETQTQRETETDKQTKTQKDRQRKIERERQRETETHIHRETDRDIETETEKREEGRPLKQTTARMNRFHRETFLMLRASLWLRKSLEEIATRLRALFASHGPSRTR